MKIETILNGEIPESTTNDQFFYKFNKPMGLKSPMPKLEELLESCVEHLGKEGFKKNQNGILETWAFRSGYSLEYKDNEKLYEFTHVSLLKN